MQIACWTCMNLSVQNWEDGFLLLGCQTMTRQKQTDLCRATIAVGRVALAWSSSHVSSAWPMYLLIVMSVQQNWFRWCGDVKLCCPPNYTLVLLWLIILIQWKQKIQVGILLIHSNLFASLLHTNGKTNVIQNQAHHSNKSYLIFLVCNFWCMHISPCPYIPMSHSSWWTSCDINWLEVLPISLYSFNAVHLYQDLSWVVIWCRQPFQFKDKELYSIQQGDYGTESCPQRHCVEAQVIHSLHSSLKLEQGSV